MKFYIGQRVRIKWSNGWPELAGVEGTIVGDMIYGENNILVRSGVEKKGTFAYKVAPDTWGTNQAPREGALGGLFFAPTSDQLEPIQPSGWKTVEWEDCLLNPMNGFSFTEIPLSESV